LPAISAIISQRFLHSHYMPCFAIDFRQMLSLRYDIAMMPAPLILPFSSSSIAARPFFRHCRLRHITAAICRRHEFSFLHYFSPLYYRCAAAIRHDICRCFIVAEAIDAAGAFDAQPARYTAATADTFADAQIS
jgi:hypothetical protein